VSELSAAPGGSPGSPRFVQYLRAHIRGARIAAVEMLDGERQPALRLRGKDGDTTLLLAIFGRKSNVVVLDGAGAIAMTLRPLTETRPELKMGEAWQPPGRAVPTTGDDRFEDVDDDAMLAEIERASAERARADAEDDTRRRIESALRKEAKGLDRKLEKLARELANAETATQLERDGELLKSALDRVKRGDSEVTVQDFTTGEDVRIDLDAKLGPAENLERLFKRYRKGIRALTKAGAQHAAVQEARDDLGAFEAELAALSDGEALEAFAARKDIARLLKKYAPVEPGGWSPANTPTGRRIRTIRRPGLPSRVLRVARLGDRRQARRSTTWPVR
jgi:predicted ribosome quality control (RQC) complex YloA/Tae2 family protein